jgi:hypothetical protein
MLEGDEEEEPVEYAQVGSKAYSSKLGSKVGSTVGSMRRSLLK